MTIDANDDRDALWRQVGSATAAAETGAPGLLARFDTGAWCVLSEVDTWTANWIAAYGPDCEPEALRGYLDAAFARGRTTSVVVDPAAYDVAHPLFAGKPMRREGNPPLMWRDAGPTLPNPRPYTGTVREIARGEDMRPVLDLISRSFEVDPALGQMTLADVLAEPAMRLFVATSDSLDSTCLTYTSGPTTYIFIMATEPARQRRGAGWAVLERAMDAATGAGATGFYLMASSAGQPLYRALGFATFVEPEFWTIYPKDAD